MIRVLFNIRLDDAYLPEHRGQMVRDAAEARSAACTIVRRLVAEHGGEPRLLNAVMALTLEDGTSLLDLSFFEALYVPVEAPGSAGTDLRRAAAIRNPAFPSAARLRAALAPVLSRLRVWATLCADLLPFRRDPQVRTRLAFEPAA